MSKKKKILFIILGIVILGSIVLLLTNRTIQAQIKDFNGNETFEKLESNFFEFNNPQALEEFESVLGEGNAVGHFYPLGEEGLYGELIDDGAFNDLEVEKTDENLQKAEFSNKKRTHLLGKLQDKILEESKVEVLDNEIKDGKLIKTVKVNSFLEYKFRTIYYYLAGKIYAEYEGEEVNEIEDTFWLNKTPGKLFETFDAQAKAMEILIDNFDLFRTDETVEIEIVYTNENGEWKMDNDTDLLNAMIGSNLKGNDAFTMEELEANNAERKQIAEDLFDKYIKGKDKDEIFKLNVSDEEINKVVLNNK